MPNRAATDAKVIGLCAVLSGAIFVVDLLIPLGVAAGVPYVAPVLLASWTSDRRFILLLAAAGSGLTVLGYLISPEGGVHWMVLANRGLALLAIWITAILAYRSRRSEDKLGRSEEQVRLLLNSTAEAIYGIDLKGNCTFSNPACIQMLGYAGGEELLGRHLHDLIHHTRPDGTPYPGNECHIYRAFRAGEAVHVDDEVLWRKDGTSFPAEYWSYPVRRDGQVVGAVVTFLDITERKGAEKAIREAHDSLEQRVEERTSKLQQSNQALEIEIAERERAEEALRKNEALLQAILDYSPTKIHIKDADGRYVVINRQSELLFGMTDEEARGKTTHDIFPGATADSFAEHDRTVLKTGNTLEQEEDWLLEDRIHTYLTVKFPIRDASGKTTAVGAIGTDITERKRVEAALRESEAGYANAERIASLGNWERDLGTGEARWSDEAYRIFGLEPGEFELSFDDLTKAVHPEDRDILIEGVRRAREDETVGQYDNEYRIVRPDGSVRFVHSQAEIIRDETDKALRMMGTVQDITERKLEEQARHRAEKRLRDAVESIADGFVLFDADDRVVMWNQRFADMYPELAPLLPTRPTAEDMFRERNRVGAVGQFDVPEEQYVRWRMEMRQKQGGTPAIHRHSDGRWFRTTERPTTEGGIVAISTDVSELKNRETDLHQAKVQAELANRAKSEFLANMSHELRTPLNAIIGFSEMIKNAMFGPVGNPKYVDYANDINVSGLHLFALINDILDLSKIEAGKVELDDEAVDVKGLVESCLTLVGQRARDSGLTIEKRIPDDLPTLWADDRKVKQILLNLLSNAVKFTPSGGKVSIGATVEPDSGVAIMVSDTGIGIAPEDIPKAMDAFRQVDSALSRKYDGTGLGLPLAKSLVELHGGTLSVQSEVGVGTSVTVRFPAARMQERAAQAV